MKIGTEGELISVLGFNVSLFDRANEDLGSHTPTGLVKVKYALGPTALVLFHIREAATLVEQAVERLGHLAFYTQIFEALERNIPDYYAQPVHVEKVDFFQIGERIPVTCRRSEGGGLHLNH